MVFIAFVHHANQYIITNGYQNREGLDELVGASGSSSGYLKVLDVHKAYRIPLNLHLSGTLLEALLWHRQDFLVALRELKQEGLVHFIGSSYGQNIMRFFSTEHNLRQLNEELRLYRDHLGVCPREVTAFWPPERIWDTKKLAHVLTDSSLLNGGYRYVLIDDRLFYPDGQGSLSRRVYDRTQEWRVVNFFPHHILYGHGLTALPIANGLRQTVPPRNELCLATIKELLRWLSAADSRADGTPIAIYGDDLEKAAGVAGWDARGPSQYEALLYWVSQCAWVRAVALSEWAPASPATSEKRIDVGTFVEMSDHFGAGEGYDNWYFDPHWDRYRSYYSWSERKVKALTARGADPSLVELAWKHLLASSWETAWHTPPCGVHGSPSSAAGVSPWSKAIASHSRAATVIAEAAFWMTHKAAEAQVFSHDIDNDGEAELVFRNDKLFAVFSLRWGGRLVYLFRIDRAPGTMVVGNPCDDWNWMEELNRYMEVPANHPGAFTDIGYEHDRYDAFVGLADGIEARATLVNRQEQSVAIGLRKAVRLARDSNELEVTYQLPEELPSLAVECGLSPDYLHLLRSGRRSLTESRSPTVWECSSKGVTAWLRLGDAGSAFFDEAGKREFGHGQAITVKATAVKATARRFTIWIGAGRPGDRPT